MIVESAVGQRPLGWLRLERGDVRLQHLQVVQPAERVLRALHGADRRRRGLDAGVKRQLHRVAKLLGGDAHLVQLLRRIHVSGRRHRGGERLGPLEQPRAERVAPRLGALSPPAPRSPKPDADRASRRLTWSRRLSITARRASRSVTTRPRTPSSAGRGSVSSATSSSMICNVTSSSRTVPSALVSRRILPRALRAFVPLTPDVSTGTASRNRRDATRA